MIWTAFILGLGGSFHCVGMCGPIAALVPASEYTFSIQLYKSLLYNMGRIVTYAVFGAVFGFLGKGLFIAGFQQGLSLTFGGLMILAVIFPVVLRKLKPQSPWFSLVNSLKGKIFPLIKKQSYFGSFTVGLINGLLPCGLVYAALAGAVLMGNPLASAQYMVVFGVGTALVLMVLSFGSSLLSFKYRKNVTKIFPLLLFLLGFLFLLRGLNLNIPYLSPKIEKNQKVSCH